MAVSFDIGSKFQQSQRKFDAATFLLHAQFFNEATTMYWLSIRDRLFGWLEKRQIPFDSTQTALVAAISSKALEEIHSDLAFVYTVGIMAEWDEGFSVNNEQATKYKSICEALIPHLMDL